MSARIIKIIIIFLFVVAAIAAFLFLKNRKASPPSITIPTARTTYKSLAPGVSTRDEVVAALGTPLNATSSPVLDFKSSNPNLPHTVSIEKNTAVFIKEQITLEDEITKEGLIQLWGEPKETLFGPYSVNGFNLYVYPDKGVAFLGHVTGSGVLEIWYFPPTTIDDFIQTWGAAYSKVHKPRQ